MRYVFILMAYFDYIGCKKMSIIFSIISIITGIIGSHRYGLVNNKEACSAALVCSQGERNGLSDCRLFVDRCLHPDGCDIFSPTLSALQLSCSISLIGVVKKCFGIACQANSKQSPTSSPQRLPRSCLQ